MREITIDLTDSDGNAIMALLEYNELYPRDHRIVRASVYIKGDWRIISNLEMIHAQYREEILQCVNDLT